MSGTDDDTLGTRLFWDGPDWLDARFDYSTSERDFDGGHQIAFSGETEDVRPPFSAGGRRLVLAAPSHP